MQIEGLDELDNKILEVIKNDARRTYSEIGQRVGLSRVAVKNRMDVMEQKGIIKGYRTVVNVEEVENTISFYLTVRTRPNAHADVIRALADESIIRKICSVTGDSVIMAEGRTTSTKKLHAFTNLFYNNTYGVEEVRYQIVIDVLKDEDGGVAYEDRRCQNAETTRYSTGQR